MSFYTITNAKERDNIVKEYLALKDRIKKRSMDERIGNIEEQQQLNNTLNPIVKSNEETRSVIKDSIRPLAEEIKSLNENIQIGNNDSAAAITANTRTGTEDQYYGFVRYKDKILMGNKEVHIVDENTLKVNDVEYNLTVGLWSLITDKNPHSYTENDLQSYTALVLQTNVINHPNNVTSRSRPKTTTKFRKILKPIMEKEEEQQQAEEKEKTGKGINDDIVHFLPKDINSLVQKLQLLVGEYVAGNKTTRNEIVAILDNLKGRNKIQEEEYKQINALLK